MTNADPTNPSPKPEPGGTPGAAKLERVPFDERSPAELDAAVLKAARRAVRFHWLTVLLEKLHPRGKSSWKIPLSLAFGICLGLVLAPYLERQSEYRDAPIVRAGETPSEIPGINTGTVTGEAPAPEAWLKSIATLILEGRVNEADEELGAFRERYPQYGEVPPAP